MRTELAGTAGGVVFTVVPSGSFASRPLNRLTAAIGGTAEYGTVSATGLVVLGRLPSPAMNAASRATVVPANWGPVPSGLRGLPTGSSIRFTFSCCLTASHPCGKAIRLSSRSFSAMDLLLRSRSKGLSNYSYFRGVDGLRKLPGAIETYIDDPADADVNANRNRGQESDIFRGEVETRGQKNRDRDGQWVDRYSDGCGQGDGCACKSPEDVNRCLAVEDEDDGDRRGADRQLDGDGNGGGPRRDL